MDLKLSDEQRILVSTVRRFIREEIIPLEAELDPDAYELPREERDRLRAMVKQMGLYQMDVPEEFGGPGVDLTTQVLLAEEMSQHRAGLYAPAYGVFGHGPPPQLYAANEHQKEKYLYPALRGEKRSFLGLTEPSGGSDPARAIQTRGVRDGDDWVINGSKIFITNGSIADSVIVIAVTDPDAGPGQGVSAFIVETGNPGFGVEKDLDKMGTRSSPLSLLHFDDCRVPADALLGQEGSALWQVGFECFDWERCVMIASSIGGMRASLTAAIEYTKQRNAFGKPLAKHQAMQHKIAEMKANLDAASLLLYRAAWMKQEGLPHQIEASVAKYFVAEAAMRNAIEATQIFGGYGYIKEYPVERAMRDAKLISIGGGTSEIQKMIIARGLLGE